MCTIVRNTAETDLWEAPWKILNTHILGPLAAGSVFVQHLLRRSRAKNSASKYGIHLLAFSISFPGRTGALPTQKPNHDANAKGTQAGPMSTGNRSEEPRTPPCLLLQVLVQGATWQVLQNLGFSSSARESAACYPKHP